MININDIWQTTLDELSKLMQVVTFEVWIEKLEPVCIYDNKLVLCAPTVIAKRTIENKHQDTIDEVLTAVHPQISGTIIINDNRIRLGWIRWSIKFSCDCGVSLHIIWFNPSKN